MTKIILRYKLGDNVREFGCVGWDIYHSWLPYNGTQPIEMTVIEDGKVTKYTEFELIRKTRLGIDYHYINPVK
jgi:hypothetical protein